MTFRGLCHIIEKSQRAPGKNDFEGRFLMEIKEKLVTVEQIKDLSGRIQSNIAETAEAAEDNAEEIAALKTTTQTHTTDIAGLKSTDSTHTADISALKTTTETHTTQIQAIKDSVATMQEFKQYLGLTDN